MVKPLPLDKTFFSLGFFGKTNIFSWLTCYFLIKHFYLLAKSLSPSKKYIFSWLKHIFQKN
jgi:hypothetical protein